MGASRRRLRVRYCKLWRLPASRMKACSMWPPKSTTCSAIGKSSQTITWYSQSSCLTPIVPRHKVSMKRWYGSSPSCKYPEHCKQLMPQYAYCCSCAEVCTSDIIALSDWDRALRRMVGIMCPWRIQTWLLTWTLPPTPANCMRPPQCRPAERRGLDLVMPLPFGSLFIHQQNTTQQAGVQEYGDRQQHIDTSIAEGVPELIAHTGLHVFVMHISQNNWFMSR